MQICALDICLVGIGSLRSIEPRPMNESMICFCRACRFLSQIQYTNTVFKRHHFTCHNEFL